METRQVALGALDLSIGVAATGIDGLARGVRLAARLAAPPVRLAMAAGQTAAGYVPAEPAERLRESGAMLRSFAEIAVRDRLQALVPLVLDAVLDQVDLTDLVVSRVDLDRVVLHVDIDAVAARMDLIGLAEYVVDGIDLPKIVRDSTGSMASEGVRGVRMQSIEADEALAHFVDRILLRRRSRSTAAELQSEDGATPLAGGAEP